MKKIILGIICTLIALPSIAQIKLEENKTLPIGQIKEETQNIANIGNYYAGVVAYALICKFPDPEIKIIYDSYFKKLAQFNLSDSDRDYIRKNYEKEFMITMLKNKDKNNTDPSCDKFKPEYEKILEYVKK